MAKRNDDSRLNGKYVPKKDRKSNDYYNKETKTIRPFETKAQRRRTNKDAQKADIRNRDKASMNDISWYALNEQLLRDTSSLPYSWATGLAMKQSRNFEPIDNYVVPGILAAHVSLSPLTLASASDPVNVAARQIVGYIRSYNSGAKNYDANDLMIRLLAEGHFLSFLNYAVRIYATVNMYSAYNKYMPNDLLRMQDVDPDSIRINAATYRSQLNTIISKASSILYIPNNLHLYKRWAWLFSNYFTDSNNPKDQLYLLTPATYSIFSLDDNSMGQLESCDWTNAGVPEASRVYHTYEDIIDALNTMLDPLIEDQELCIMTGDMMKAYGPSSLSLQLIPENLTAIPASDPLVLQQFKSSRALPCVGGAGYEKAWNDIVQDDDAYYLTRKEQFVLPDNYSLMYLEGGSTKYATGTDATGVCNLDLLGADALLDSPNPNPTAVDNMENTRLMVMPVKYNEGEEDMQVVEEWANGSEVVVFYTIGYRTYVSPNTYRFNRFVFYNTINMVDAPVGWVVPNTKYSYYCTVSQGQELLSMLENFDYSPTVYSSFTAVVEDDELVMHHAWRRPHMRISNYALLPATMLEKMNNCALLSMLNITGFQPK